MILAGLGAAAWASSADAEPVRGPKSGAVDAVFAEYGAKTPGCAVAVDQDGWIVHAAGYGMADLEQSVPIAPASVYPGCALDATPASKAGLLKQ